MIDDKETKAIDKLRDLGWRQGSVVPTALVNTTSTHGSQIPKVDVNDWLIVVSHTCDVRNPSMSNEPSVEILVARSPERSGQDSRQTHGRNSRRLQFEGTQDEITTTLVAKANERFVIDRLLLASAPPDQSRRLGSRGEKTDATLQILVTWLAKRYWRQAFPDEFDSTASKAKGKVDTFLTKNAATVLGVFIAFADRKDKNPRFHLEFRVVVKSQAVTGDWAGQKADLERIFDACWAGVSNIAVEAVAVKARDFSVGEMVEGGFKKFDRDWISYAFDPEGDPAPGGG